MKVLLICLLALLGAVSCQGEPKCKRELIDSHNLMSLPDPAKGKLVLCPHIKQTCIPSFEQFKMFAWYNDAARPNFELTRDVIKLELTLLNDLFKGIVDGMMGKVSAITDDAARLQAIDLLTRLKKKKIDRVMKTAIEEQTNAANYMIKMKTAYFCVLGDYNSHRFLDVTRQQYTMTDSSCDDLVKNTLVYSNALNRGIVPFLESLLNVHQKIAKKEQVVRLAGSMRMGNATKECADQFKIADEGLSSCKKYCSYFRLNADSPAFEGYPEFFSNALWELKDYAPASKGGATKGRILGETMSRLLNSRRRLEEAANKTDALDTLDPDSLLPIDLFEENSVDPDFDDAAMIEAFKVQRLLTRGEAFDPATVVRKHYIDEYEVPMDDLESKNVFNVPSEVRVDVSAFKGDVLVAGIDFPTIIKDMNWNMTIDEIAKALVTGKRAGQKEMVDPVLIMAINELDNAYVRKFHNDLLLNFKDFRFEYRIKQLEQVALDEIQSNVKTADQTMAVLIPIVKSNVSDSAQADKIISDATAKLKGSGNTSSTVGAGAQAGATASTPTANATATSTTSTTQPASGTAAAKP